MVAPFHAGGPIPTALATEFMIGFEEERRTLIQYMNRRSPIRLGLFGPEGAGKTSLLLSAAPQLPAARVHLNCDRIWPHTNQGFYHLLAQALGQANPNPPLPERPLEAYQQFPLPRKGTAGVLVLEEADHLQDIDKGLLDELPVLAIRMPYHMVLTGRADALQKFVEASIVLKPFSDATATDFLRQRFQAQGMTVSDDALRVFNEFCRGLPDALQRLGHETYTIAKAAGRRTVSADDVDLAVSVLVDHLPARSLEAWSGLRGIMRDVFIAMCLYDLQSPTLIAKRIGAEPKNIIVLLNRLVNAHGVVERVERGQYRVQDLLLKHYVRKEWSSPVLR